MTIILCTTIIANTFSNKTIFEFNDDQFLCMLFFLLQFVFILYQRFQDFFLYHNYKIIRNVVFICVARNFKTKFKIFFVFDFYLICFFENFENCSCFVQFMTFDLILLQFQLFWFRTFTQNNNYYNLTFALLFEIWLNELFYFARNNNLIVNFAILTIYCFEIQNLNWKQ